MAPISAPSIDTSAACLYKNWCTYFESNISIRSVIRTPCPNEVNLNGWIQFRHQSFVAKTSAMTVQPNTTSEDVCRYKIRVIAYHITSLTTCSFSSLVQTGPSHWCRPRYRLGSIFRAGAPCAYGPPNNELPRVAASRTTIVYCVRVLSPINPSGLRPICISTRTNCSLLIHTLCPSQLRRKSARVV